MSKIQDMMLGRTQRPLTIADERYLRLYYNHVNATMKGVKRRMRRVKAFLAKIERRKV